ncbi:hypothetical protein Tco_1138665 [Tanacetum coccineum]
MINVASWNIRGMNISPKQNEVRQVIFENKFLVCAILESYVTGLNLERMCKYVFHHWNWVSNAMACIKGTQVILGWNQNDVDIKVIHQDAQVVHTRIWLKVERKELFCSFIYAHNRYTQRRALWNGLCLHKSYVRNRPWCLLGDFNASLFVGDTSAGSSSMDIAMREFKDCVDDIEVIDVQRTGLQFTWNQKPKGKDGILKKLDRIMANLEFHDGFVGAHAIFKLYRISNHSPSVLYIPTNAKISGFHMFKVVKKLKLLKKPIRKLLYDKGNLHANVIRLRVDLDRLQTELDNDPFNVSLREEETASVITFNEALIMEERFLKQKAKIKWLKEGDSNSAYFHKAVKIRTSRSRIDVVSNAEGVVFQNEKVAEAFISHYEVFLGEPVIKMLKRRCFLWGMISPGPNGYTAAFFKETWDIIGTNVTNALMHNYNLDRGVSRCAFKVDIQKAYDTADSDFLKVVLNNFGFHDRMVSWIMECFSTTSFSISINGSLYGYFKGKRGLRQGDPLSPYLFTLIMEVLMLMLQRRVRDSNSFSYPKYCSKLELFNLCFMDDLFLFAHGDVNSAKVIKDTLDEFKNASRLTPSLPKSTTYFCNVLNHTKLAILHILPFEEGRLSVKYLGVPLWSFRLIFKDCKELIEKVQNRINDWKNKSLSIADMLQLT